MLEKVQTVSCLGLECQLVTVETDISRQRPNTTIVGLADTAVQEARERVRSACENSSLPFPRTRVIVNLAPANVRKEGTSFDVPIAVSILLARGIITTSARLAQALFVGELALTGEIRGVRNILTISAFAQSIGIQSLFVPAENAAEASLIPGITIYATHHLQQLVHHLNGTELITPFIAELSNYLSVGITDSTLSDIRGQEQAKRVLEIAAAGGHNVFFSGPPGSGKTLLARSLLSILPPLSLDEALDVSKIYSCAGLLPSDNPLMQLRPFRSPHHSASLASLVGGGSTPRPGEITLAHRGVLFLDELNEFPRHVLDALRQPLEERVVTISRAQAVVRFPARFILIAAANPCPCGYYGYDHWKPCVCRSAQLIQYQRRLSGPLLDRIDMYLEVVPVEHTVLLQKKSIEDQSEKIRQNVYSARERQTVRYQSLSVNTNADLSFRDLPRFCPLSPACHSLLDKSASALRLSSRATHKIIKLARTIADLSDAEEIAADHILEALQYRKVVQP